MKSVLPSLFWPKLRLVSQDDHTSLSKMTALNAPITDLFKILVEDEQGVFDLVELLSLNLRISGLGIVGT